MTAGLLSLHRHGPLGFFLLLGVLPFLVSNYSVYTILTLTFIWGMATFGYNITNHTGLISLGHSAVFGIGGLISLLLFLSYGWSPWIGMLVGAGVATAFYVAITIPMLRLSSAAFAFATLTIPLILLGIVNYLGYTEVIMPLGNSPLNFEFTSPIPYYLIALIGFVLAIYVTYALEKSKIGLFMRATRDDEAAAEASGVDTSRYKLLSIAIGAFITAMAGTLYVQYLGLFTPDLTFGLNSIVQITIISVIGGSASVWGPVVGTFLLIPLGEYLQFLVGNSIPGLHLIVYGAILMIVITMMPEGIYVWYRDRKGTPRKRTVETLQNSG